MVFSLFSWHTSGFKWCVTYRLGHFFHTDDRNVEFFPPFCFSSASPACVWRSILLAQNFSSSNTTVLGKAPQSYLFFGLYILLATLTVNKGRTLVNVESQLQQRPLTIAVAFFSNHALKRFKHTGKKNRSHTERVRHTVQSSESGKKGERGEKVKRLFVQRSERRRFPVSPEKQDKTSGPGLITTLFAFDIDTYPSKRNSMQWSSGTI